MAMKQTNGFSLMELMVVLAVIFILLAIAIPGMREMMIHANEASAVASIRAINTSEVSYQATYGGYAESLGQLGGAEPCTKSADTACLLDESLAGGEKSGYQFAAVGGSASGGRNATYLASAVPDAFGKTGTRIFCSTDRGVIRVDQNAERSTTPPSAEQCAAFPALK
jgi:type IV pilus assembly protein PilA